MPSVCTLDLFSVSLSATVSENSANILILLDNLLIMKEWFDCLLNYLNVSLHIYYLGLFCVFSNSLLAFYNLLSYKKITQAREMAHWLRAQTALWEDQSSAPISHIRQLTTGCNSYPNDLMLSSGLFKNFTPMCTPPPHTYIITDKILFYKKSN